MHSMYMHACTQVRMWSATEDSVLGNIRGAYIGIISPANLEAWWVLSVFKKWRWVSVWVSPAPGLAGPAPTYWLQDTDGVGDMEDSVFYGVSIWSLPHYVFDC